MKKFLGVLFLVIGLFAIVSGIVAISSIETENRSLEGQVQSEFVEQYKTNQSQNQAAGGALAFSGLLFYITGIVLLVTKTKKQRVMEAELLILKNQNITTFVSETKEDNISKIEKLGVLKEKGLLSNEEFEKEKKKLL